MKDSAPSCCSYGEKITADGS
uniref:Uncharacterized protein n=1 Tax=Arundo donax TaxID=35708 RepID=A0A0A8YLY7_ARUDO